MIKKGIIANVLIVALTISVILVSLIPPIIAETRTTVFYPRDYLNGDGGTKDFLIGDADWWAPYGPTDGKVGVMAKCGILGSAHAWAYRFFFYQAAATGSATIEFQIEYTGGSYEVGTGWSSLSALLWVDPWEPKLDAVEGSASVFIPRESWSDVLETSYEALETILEQYKGDPNVVHTHTVRRDFQFQQNQWYVIRAGLDVTVTGCLVGSGIKIVGKVKSITVTEYSALPMPDLTVSPEDIHTRPDGFPTHTPRVGQPLTISADVHNLGDADASNFYLQFFDNDALIATSFITFLPCGHAIRVHVQWTPKTAGGHTIRVTADATNTIAESNENNNWAEITIPMAFLEDL